MIHCEQTALVRKFTGTVALVIIGFFARAQEVDCSVSANCGNSYCQFAANIEKGCNCFDGADNDGDGKVDKADSNCAVYYGLEFVGEGSDCSIVPPGSNTPFDLVNAPITSDQNTADTQSKISVGDVDGDGIPDAVITSKWNSEIRVVATAPGQADGTAPGDVKSDFKTTGQGAKIFSGTGGCAPKNLLFEHENLIADIDGDGKAELFGVVSNRGGNPSTPPTCFFLVAFTYAQDNLVPMYNAIQIGTDRPGTFGIADMDGDGKAEIYLRDRIYAAETGALLATGNGNWDVDITAGPVAVDVVGDDKMELVCGTKIYSIPDFSNRNPATPANLTLVADMNAISADKAYVKLAIDPIEYGIDTHSMTSVADIDRDGNMDVVISGALNAVNGPTAVFYWNVAKGTVSYYLPQDPSYANGWPWGTGRVNLGDANGDGNTDLTFMAGAYLHSLTTDAAGNLVPLWPAPRQINDSRSGVLTVSIYDFDNDGNPEIVYRDSQELAVIDGATGTQKLWSAVCQSHTYTEGVVIADVNGDGATDICVPCNTNNSFNINDPIQQQALGQFRLYFSSGNEWLPTRKVWNQPGYFVVNVNDDLTLPFPQLDQNIIFGDGDCANGLPGPQMPMNVFLNQVPFLSANGCPVYPAPDLSFAGDNPDTPGVDENGDGVYTPAVEVIPPICGDLGISVRFNIINDGDLPITDNIPVSFFVGDPTDPSITSDSLIHSTTLNVVNLAIDSIFRSPFVTFNGTGGAFRLYIVLNNDGSVLPINPAGSVPNECRIDNNIYSVFIQPDPFTTRIEKIKDNFKCSDAAPDNGELRVRIFKGTTEVTDYSQYGFQWYNGTATSYSPIAGATNYNLTGVAEGDYTAIVTNTAKGCVGLPVDTTVLRLGNDPEVVINVISHQTVCNPPNGALEAQVTGGNLGYTFEWFDSIADSIGISGPIATNLSAGNYIVRVSKDGCSKNSLPQTVDGPTVPDAEASTLSNVVDCLNPSSGSVTATALFSGVAQDPAEYKFDWYFYDNATSTRGSILPAIHGSGPTRTGLPVGFYQVTITHTGTQCRAVQLPVTEIIDQRVVPTALITELAPQTSCDFSNPNARLGGEALQAGITQDPSAYTFEWFKGDNTLPAYAHTSVSGVNGSIAEKVSAGGTLYTLKITTANNCSGIDTILVSEDLNIPVVTLTTTDNSICDPALAASVYNGSVTASIAFDGTPVTDFTNYEIKWHRGSLTTDPLIPGETSLLLDEQNGGYYTIVVERTDLACVSDPIFAEIKNVLALPVIQTDSIASTNCEITFDGDPISNGEVSVSDVDAGSPLTNYTFQWSDDGTTPTPTNATTPVVGYLEGGYSYDVLVVNTLTGCSNTKTVNLPKRPVKPVIAVNKIRDNVNCDPLALGSTGELEAIVSYGGAQLNTPGITPLPAEYVITWSNNSNGDLLTGQPAGTYSAVVVNEALGCTSDPDADVVLDAFVYPTIDIPVIVSQTSCDATTPNGEIQAIVTDGLGSTFNHTWYLGIGTGGIELSNLPTQADGATSSLVDMASSDYTIFARNEGTGCEAIKSVFIPDSITYPAIVFTSTDPVTTCGLSPNGAATPDVTGLSSLPDYHYTVYYVETFTGGNYPTDPATIKGGSTYVYNNPALAQPPVYGGLAPGYISALVVDNNTKCESNPVTAPILNATEQYDLSIDGTAKAGFCGGDGGGIEVTVERSDNPGVPCATCTYEWYKATPVNTDPINFFNNPPDMGGAPMVTLAVNEDLGMPAAPPGVGAGTYTLVVVDTDPAHLGCGNYFVEAVGFAAAPVITVTETDVSRCIAPFDGQIDVNVTGGSLVGYSIEIFSGNGPAGTLLTSVGTPVPQSSPLVHSASMLQPGQFYVQVVDYEGVNSNCPLGSVHELSRLAFNPLIALNQVVENTSCDPATSADGKVELTAHPDPQQVAVTNFQISAVTPLPIGLMIPRDIPDDETSSGLMSGFAPESYTLTVTDINSGCYADAVVNIPDRPVMPTIFEADAFDDSYCAPTSNGRIIVREVGIDVSTPEPVTNYEFEWYTDASAANLVYQAIGGGATTGDIFDGTKPGWSFGTTLGGGNGNREYFVRGRRIIGDGTGCFTPLIQKNVLDVHQTPDISLTTFDNTSCIDMEGEGVIRAVTDIASDPLDPNVQGIGTYTYTWNPDPAGGTISGGGGLVNGQGIPRATSFDITALADGSYTVTSTNSVNGCAVTSTSTVNTNTLPITLVRYLKEDQLICNPDGSIKVSEVVIDASSTANPAVYSFVDSGDPLTNLSDNFDFVWFDADNDGDGNADTFDETQPIQSAGADINDDILTEDLSRTLQPYADMGAGSYYVVAIRKSGLSPGAGCTTVPLRINVSDLHVDPTVSLTYEPNSSCDPINPNGIVIATAAEQDNSTVDTYTFSWTLNGGPLDPVTVPSNTSNNVGRLDEAADGLYVVTATNASNTGCSISASIDVLKDLNISTPNIIEVATIDPVNCYPTGSASVTKISIGGLTFYNNPPDNLDNTFDYQWYKTDFSPATEIPGAVNHDLTNIEPDKYYVIVQDLSTACKSSPKEVVILPDNIVYPVIDITQTQRQISCPATFGTGVLVALADGRDDSDVNYEFTWYNNLDASGTAIATTSTISGLIAGDYSVSVLNQATGCSATDLYIISNESEDYYPQLALITQPRTNCLVTDGTLLAREVTSDPLNQYPFVRSYTTELYPGGNPDISQPGSVMTANGGFNRNWISRNLDIGVYTVKITDNNTGCVVTEQAEVLDGRTPPLVDIVEDNPLINCDPARPNGQLSATADGGLVGGYGFAWYNGPSAAGNVIGNNNNKLIGLPMGQFTVRVTNDLTGCFADGTGDITDGRLVPPSPTALLIFDRTRCDYPDGWVAAEVNGVTFNYTFDWYDGMALKTSPDFRGVNYRNRDIGFYTVTAMDQTTGCISLPVSVEVKDLRVIPEVIVHTQPSYCDELPDAPGGNGSAELELVPSNIVTDQIEWTEYANTSVIGIGSYISGVLPGFYQANIITSQGCEATGVGEVKTEVFSYNLVSSNGDRKNDNFMIDCISQFPNNNVKIFNRSGVLVFEANGYDNKDVVFKGIGERGVYTIGNELPVGTYFYIIDKRDGSKPKTGYLELVR